MKNYLRSLIRINNKVLTILDTLPEEDAFEYYFLYSPDTLVFNKTKWDKESSLIN